MATSSVVVLPTCSICSDEEAGLSQGYAVTPCGHVFHTACIERWDTRQRLNGRTTRCPYCTRSLRHTPSSSARFITIHALTEQHIDDTSSLKQLIDDQAKIIPSLEEQITTIRSSLDQKNQKIKELELEPARLKEEKKLTDDSLLEAQQQLAILTSKLDKSNHDLKCEKHSNTIERALHRSHARRLKAGLEHWKGKCFASQKSCFQLQKQLDIKSYNDEQLRLLLLLLLLSSELKQLQIVGQQLQSIDVPALSLQAANPDSTHILCKTNQLGDALQNLLSTVALSSNSGSHHEPSKPKPNLTFATVNADRNDHKSRLFQAPFGLTLPHQPLENPKWPSKTDKIGRIVFHKSAA
ncbi:hypothetical protein O181_005364 [Austropuccinia psidii MF-1]|uniref:RING-type domain-containing protein n=1 Tax=Austropuccinia psidii MF-1 TaxID=1389203 RepID=A0A9Q3BHZ2_9BASI|nr:hypothetical protein [Austropuccinia psidii MF-1]